MCPHPIPLVHKSHIWPHLGDALEICTCGLWNFRYQVGRTSAYRSSCVERLQSHWLWVSMISDKWISNLSFSAWDWGYMLALHLSLEPCVQQGDCPCHAGRTQHPKHDYQRYFPIPREPSPDTGSSSDDSGGSWSSRSGSKASGDGGRYGGLDRFSHYSKHVCRFVEGFVRFERN